MSSGAFSLPPASAPASVSTTSIRTGTSRRAAISLTVATTFATSASARHRSTGHCTSPQRRRVGKVHASARRSDPVANAGTAFKGKEDHCTPFNCAAPPQPASGDVQA